jgi:hypothetical protein
LKTFLKTTSGSSPKTDLSKNITFSWSQYYPTVPLRPGSCAHLEFESGSEGEFIADPVIHLLGGERMKGLFII